MAPALQHHRVLVVEDDRDIRESLAEVLSSEGYVVAEAWNGLDALERARSFRPELILLDLTMPVMDGYEFLAARRAEAALSSTPVIVVTARHPAPVIDCEVLYKPFDLDALLEAARRNLGAVAQPAPRP